MRPITTAALLMACLSLSGQSDYEKAGETVSKNTVESHIYFLADDLLGGRETGSRGNKIAAAYLAAQLRRFGAQPNPETGDYYQPFSLYEVSPPEILELSLMDGDPLRTAALQTRNIDEGGEAVYANYGEAEDYVGLEVEGKFVVVKGGTPEGANLSQTYQAHLRKTEAAKARGALGLVEMVTFDDATWGQVDRALGRRTVISPPDSNGFVRLWAAAPELPGNLRAGDAIPIGLRSGDPVSRPVHTQNVVGLIEGSDPELKDEFIVYSAHYDHIGTGTPDETGDSIYNGARDNGIGTTAVLSIAENLGKYPTRRSAVFIFFSAEELGLLGSRYYVEHPIVPLEKTVYCFNTDGGGYNNTTLATIIGLNRTTAREHILEGARAFGLEPVDDPVPEQGLFDRSDNVSFAQAGVPAPTYSTGFDSFDEEYLKYYHQLADEAHSLDYDYLLKFFQGYVLTGRLIGNSEETPFWVTGDKYEPAGRELYGTATPKN